MKRTVNLLLAFFRHFVFLVAFLILSLLIPIFLGRIRMEERLLTEQFGDAYREYKASTRKLIPFVY